MPNDNSDFDMEELLDDININAGDMSADRLTELLKHQRIDSVHEYNDTFQIITREGTWINIASPPEDNITGDTTNRYNFDIQTGTVNTDGLSPSNIVELGDLVRLKNQKSEEMGLPEMTHGIVVEMLSRFGDGYDNAPRRVSLHLYNPQTNDIYIDSPAYPSPVFYDQHVQNLVLVQKASDSTYNLREVDIADFLDLEGQY